MHQHAIWVHVWVVIFLSLTEASLPDPTPTPPMDPKRTRNRPETDPNTPIGKRTRNGPKRTRNGPKSSSLGWDGRAVCRDGGAKGKRKSLRLGAYKSSETGRIRFQGVRFQTPNSVSFSGLTEFRGANSVSSFQPIICV